MRVLSAEQGLSHTRPIGAQAGVLTQFADWRGQQVFVKTLLSDEPDTRARFEHEGRVAAFLNHPAVVPLLAMTPTQLIFPFVPGGTLRERLKDGPLNVEQATSVLWGVLEAVAHLHAQGVVHHDLKPENILLRGGVADGGAVRLIDFGMSHARHLQLDIHSGTRMGTPHFMAPEQFRGVRGDPRSDLYSAGVLLFDSLAGHPPYADALGWLAGYYEERAPLPGPAELRPLLLCTLGREPQERLPSAQAMLRELAEARSRLGLRRPGSV